MKDLPVIPEVIKAKASEKGLALYNAWVGQYEFQRPFVAPPGVPKERLKILRKAFNSTFEDPQFLAETKRSRLIFT